MVLTTMIRPHARDGIDSRAVGIMIVRPALLEDMESIAAIYNDGIRGRGATFEIRERTSQDLVPWLDAPARPTLVAEIDGRVIGWARAGEYRARDAYAGIGDFSVYVATASRRRGAGDRLMSGLIAKCAGMGYWKLVGRVFPENTASRALCRRQGFREVGTYERHALLDGRWRDVVIVERLLDAPRSVRHES